MAPALSDQPITSPVESHGMTTPAYRPVSSWIGEFLLLAALWGASFLFMRLGASQFGPLPTAGLRVALATVFLWPILLHQGQWPALRKHWRPVLLSGVVNSAIPFALYSWAVLHITTGLASILNATVPLFGALVAWIWLGDRINRLRWLGLAIGFVGVALLASRAPGGASFKSGMAPWAIAACLAATVCYAIAASFTRRFLTGVPPLATATGSQLGAALGLALPMLWLWPATTPGWQAWAAIGAMAVLCTGIAYILYFRLIAHAGPSRALAVTFLAPVFAVGYGSVFLGEPVTLWMALCAGIIVLGVMLSTGLITSPAKSAGAAKQA